MNRVSKSVAIATASILTLIGCSSATENTETTVATTVATTIQTTTTISTTVPPTTTTVAEQIAPQEIPVEVTGKCVQWYELAMQVGWPSDEWPMLDRVLFRESRCTIDAHNQTDPASGSRGLMQINGYWCRPSKWSKAGWLQDRGILNTCDDLFDAETNLRAGLLIWWYGEEKHGCGWYGPWAIPCDN